MGDLIDFPPPRKDAPDAVAELEAALRALLEIADGGTLCDADASGPDEVGAVPYQSQALQSAIQNAENLVK